jgi:enoyl-CoA hydratase/carnithine racemase
MSIWHGGAWLRVQSSWGKFDVIQWRNVWSIGDATQRLTRAVGKFAAMTILLYVDPFDATAALAMGLASEVVPDADIEPRALQLAAQFATLRALALQFIKDAMLEGMNLCQKKAAPTIWRA